MMTSDLDTSLRPSRPARVGAVALDRAALRRAFGVALLEAWRTLGGLLGRAGERDSLVDRTVDDALTKLDVLRRALLAFRVAPPPGGAR